jgi:hypothetical protein
VRFAAGSSRSRPPWSGCRGVCTWVIADGCQKIIAEVTILKNTAPLVGGALANHWEVKYDKGMTKRGKMQKKKKKRLKIMENFAYTEPNQINMDSDPTV